MHKVTDKDAADLLASIRKDFDANYAAISKMKLRLEFPLGELARPESNALLGGLVFAARMCGEFYFPLPITGNEGFNAQGLEGKAAVTGFGLCLLIAWESLPLHRRVLYLER